MADTKLNRNGRRLLKTLNDFWPVVSKMALSKDPLLKNVLSDSVISKMQTDKNHRLVTYDVLFEIESSDFKNTRFKQCDDNTLEALKITLHHVLEIASAKSSKKKEKRIYNFDSHVNLYIRNIPSMLNGRFNRVPADQEKFKLAIDDFVLVGNKSENAAETVWFAAETLGKSIADNPSRLKICPFCHQLFWDSTTKAAKRYFCGKICCKRKWDRQRSKNSYDMRTGKKSKRGK